MSQYPESGNSTILMVLFLLLSGTTMLAGLSTHLSAQQRLGSQEARAITQFAGAQSAISWGMWQRWWPQEQWVCQTEASLALRACLRQVEGEAVLLAGFLAEGPPAGRLVHWRWGTLKKGKFIASDHGWLDYCPLGDKPQCDLA